MKEKIIAVIGPTGSGKTALGVDLALQFNGEIISADAKQVFRRMDIGTAKEKNLAVTQHLLDIRDPGEKITVGQYQELAYEVIEQLLAKRKLPILVGGSGLYAESVLKGYEFGGKGSKLHTPRYRSLLIGIDIPRDVLRERIQARTKKWIEEGLLEEIQGLLTQGVSAEWLEWCGLEYRYLTQHLQGQLNLEEALRLTNQSQMQFIKRQYTWWRRHPDVQWIADAQQAKALVATFVESD